MFEKRKIEWPTTGSVITTHNGMEYTIGQHISSGSYALVFEGIDSFGNAIALKVYKPAKRRFELVKEQWKKECRIFEIARHPNVVAIYDYFICANLCYIVLERAWGDLYRWVEQYKPLNELNVKEIARQLLFGIHFIHKRGILQRDITIYNVLVFEGPRSIGSIFKISDFGISKDLFEPWQSQINMAQVAHPHFIPPELLLPQYGYSTEQTDLYHLGLILLYALTGKFPFTENMNDNEIKTSILNGVPRQKAEKINTPFGDFISVLLRRRKEYRFKTAIETWDYLKKLEYSKDQANQ